MAKNTSNPSVGRPRAGTHRRLIGFSISLWEDQLRWLNAQGPPGLRSHTLRDILDKHIARQKNRAVTQEEQQQ